MLRINAGLFISLITMCFLGSVSHLHSDTHFSAKDIVQGKAALTLENQYQETLPLKDWLVSGWAAFRYKVFNEGREGVVVGSQQWLFTKEEYDWPVTVNSNIADNIKYINEVEQKLADKNVELLVVLLPEKVSIEADNRVRQSDHITFNLYNRVYQELLQNHIAIVDASEAMASSNQQMFLRTDTHWTPEGANVVAKYLAAAHGNMMGSDEFQVTLTDTELYRGDLLNYIPVAPYFTEMGPKADELQHYEVVKVNEESLGLFGDVSIDLALVGTSYSANANWHFVDFIKLALNRDLANFAEEGLGPFRPMESFLTSDPFVNEEFSQVIWEIPVRFLVQPLTDEIK